MSKRVAAEMFLVDLGQISGEGGNFRELNWTFKFISVMSFLFFSEGGKLELYAVVPDEFEMIKV